MRAEGNVRMLRDDDGQLQVTADSFDVASAPGVPPKVHHEVIRIGPGVACKGKDCDMPTLMSAFRWNGLNLATVDKQLGRYFGTDHGRSEEHTSELQSLMRISYAVFCLKKKSKKHQKTTDDMRQA